MRGEVLGAPVDLVLETRQEGDTKVIMVSMAMPHVECFRGPDGRLCLAVFAPPLEPREMTRADRFFADIFSGGKGAT